MIECKHLTKEDCLKNHDCIYTNGVKRQYCRKAKNTRKKKSTSNATTIWISPSNATTKSVKTKKKSTSNATTMSVKTKKKSRSRKRSATKSTSSVKILSKTSKKSLSQNLLKISNTYDDLGIKAGDFFIDPCMMLRKLKKYSNNDIYTFTTKNIKKLEYIIPLFEKHSSNKYKFGDEILVLKKQINSGAYGEIYEATINKKKVILKIPKVSHFEMKDFFLETFVQNELFCDMRGSFGQGARIPKLEFFGKMKLGNNVVGIIAMEPLDMDGYGFLDTVKNDKNGNLECINMVLQISGLLITLQKKYCFMHKDFHSGNIMCKKNGNSYKWYIIDFGMASAKINNTWLHGKLDYPYKSSKKMNKTHDLRMLFSSIFYTLLSKMRQKDGYVICPIMFLHILNRYMIQLSKYLKTPQNTLFWNTYGDVFDVSDTNFDPNNVQHTFEKMKMYLLANKPLRIMEELPKRLKNYSKQVNKSNLIRYLDEMCMYLM